MASLPIDNGQDSDAGHPAEGRASAGSRRREVRVAIWPVIVVLYAILLPREIRFSLGTLEFFADRIALLLILPYIVRKLMDGAIRFVLPDFLVVIASIWMIVSMVAHYGLSSGFERGGSGAFDTTVGYFLARISFRSLADMRKALLLFLPGAVLCGLVIMVESVVGRPIVQPLAEAVFGKAPFYAGGDIDAYRNVRMDFRYGLLRAQGPFNHPILAGLFLSSLIGIYNCAGFRGTPRLFANLVAPMAIFTVSSAAVIGLALGYGLIAYEYVQRVVRELTWKVLVLAAIIGMATIQFSSNSGLASLIGRYFTFDPRTAFYRELTWEYGIASVRAHPWFGIGYSQYDRPVWMVTGSIDTHWLNLAVRYGMIPALCLLAALIAALIALGRASNAAPKVDQLFYRGIAISLFVMGLQMFTVFLLGGLNMWFTILLGACVACAQRSHSGFILAGRESDPRPGRP